MPSTSGSIRASSSSASSSPNTRSASRPRIATAIGEGGPASSTFFLGTGWLSPIGDAEIMRIVGSNCLAQGATMNLRAELVMTDDEVRALLDRPLTLTVCTFGLGHTIHAVPLYYGFLGEDVAFHTKAKSQKIKNLERDDAITCSVFAGTTTEDLCGVTILGHATVTDDTATLRALNES